VPNNPSKGCVKHARAMHAHGHHARCAAEQPARQLGSAAETSFHREEKNNVPGPRPGSRRRRRRCRTCRGRPRTRLAPPRPRRRPRRPRRAGASSAARAWSAAAPRPPAPPAGTCRDARAVKGGVGDRVPPADMTQQQQTSRGARKPRVRRHAYKVALPSAARPAPASCGPTGCMGAGRPLQAQQAAGLHGVNWICKGAVNDWAPRAPA